MEGETDDPDILGLREQQKRNLLATLFLSAGRAHAPGRRRDGPHPAREQQRLLPGQRAVLGGLGAGRPPPVAPGVHARGWRSCGASSRCCSGGASSTESTRSDSELKDLAWFRPDGKEMTSEDWQRAGLRCLGCLLGGDAHRARRTPRGAGWWATRCWCCSTRTTSRCTCSSSPPWSGARPWEVLLETALPGDPGRAAPRGRRRCACPRARWRCSGAPPPAAVGLR